MHQFELNNAGDVSWNILEMIFSHYNISFSTLGSYLRFYDNTFLWKMNICGWHPREKSEMQLDSVGFCPEGLPASLRFIHGCRPQFHTRHWCCVCKKKCHVKIINPFCRTEFWDQSWDAWNRNREDDDKTAPFPLSDHLLMSLIAWPVGQTWVDDLTD